MPVSELQWRLIPMPPFKISSRTDWPDISLNDCHNGNRGFCFLPAEERAGVFDGHCIVDTVNEFRSFRLFRHRIRSDGGAAVEQYEARPYFMGDILEAFTVEIRHANCVLQVPESGFQPPPQAVKDT